MKKRLSVLIILLLSITLMLGSTVEATPGKLTRTSIEKCGKTKWGYHSKRRHWHKAVYHKKSGYYALDWFHEYKRVKRCSYKLSKGKKATAHKVSKKAVKKYKTYGYAKYKNKWYKVKYNKKKKAWYTSGKSLGKKTPKQVATKAYKVSKKAVKKYKTYGYAKYKNKWYKVKYNKKKKAWYTSGKSLGKQKPKQIR